MGERTGRSPEVTSLSDDERYRRLIVDIEAFCSSLWLNHRFVGGTLTDLLNPQTEITAYYTFSPSKKPAFYGWLLRFVRFEDLQTSFKLTFSSFSFLPWTAPL